MTRAAAPAPFLQQIAGRARAKRRKYLFVVLYTVSARIGTSGKRSRKTRMPSTPDMPGRPIGDDHVGPISGDRREGVLHRAVAVRAQKARRAADQHAQALSHLPQVLDDHNPGRGRTPSLRRAVCRSLRHGGHVRTAAVIL